MSKSTADKIKQIAPKLWHLVVNDDSPHIEQLTTLSQHLKPLDRRVLQVIIAYRLLMIDDSNILTQLALITGVNEWEIETILEALYDARLIS